MEFKTILHCAWFCLFLLGWAFCLSAPGKSEMERSLYGERTF